MTIDYFIKSNNKLQDIDVTKLICKKNKLIFSIEDIIELKDKAERNNCHNFTDLSDKEIDAWLKKFTAVNSFKKHIYKLMRTSSDYKKTTFRNKSLFILIHLVKAATNLQSMDNFNEAIDPWDGYVSENLSGYTLF